MELRSPTGIPTTARKRRLGTAARDRYYNGMEPAAGYARRTIRETDKDSDKHAFCGVISLTQAYACAIQTVSHPCRHIQNLIDAWSNICHTLARAARRAKHKLQSALSERERRLGRLRHLVNLCCLYLQEKSRSTVIQLHGHMLHCFETVSARGLRRTAIPNCLQSLRQTGESGEKRIVFPQTRRPTHPLEFLLRLPSQAWNLVLRLGEFARGRGRRGRVRQADSADCWWCQAPELSCWLQPWMLGEPAGLIAWCEDWCRGEETVHIIEDVVFMWEEPRARALLIGLLVALALFGHLADFRGPDTCYVPSSPLGHSLSSLAFSQSVTTSLKGAASLL